MTDFSQPLNVTPLSYAPPASGRARVWSAAVVALVGLVLLFFGGCFCVGILIHLNTKTVFGGTPAPWTSGDYLFHVVMYALAIAFFVSGAVLVVRATAGLFRIMANAQV